MALKKRESVLWGAAKFAADALRAGAVNGIFHPLFSFYDRLELQFQSGWFGLVGEHGYKRTGWQYRLRQAGMRSSEKSVFLHLFRKLLRFALQSSLASYGLLMLFTGAAFAVESILVKRFSTSVWNLAASVVLVLSSFPLLISEQSLSAALRKSRLSRAFFCDFCGIVQDRFGNFEVGKERPRFVLLLSGALSLAAYLFSPLRVCVAVALLICLWVLFAVPECTLLLIFFAFPFLGLLEHSTMVLCMLVLLADVTWFCKTVCGRRDFSFELLDLLVGLFAVLLLLGGFVGGSVWQGVSLFCLVTVYFPARNLLLQPVWRRRAVRALLAAVFSCSAYGIFQYFFTDLELKWVDVSRFSDIGGRVTGTFENPNILAIYLLMIIPHALCSAFDRCEMAAWRIFAGVSLVCAMGCVVLTWTRGAWLGVLLELVLFFVFYSRQTLAASFFLPLPLVAVFPFFPQNIIRRFQSIGSLAESSVRYRLYTWRGVGRMLRDYPFGIGVGERAFAEIYPHYAVSGTETVMHAHRLFLQIRTELGWQGLAVFAVLLCLLFLRVLARGHGGGGFFAVCGILTMGLFDHIWYHTGMLGMFFLTCSLVTAATGKEAFL